jgi:hypothetical protein
MPQPLADHLEQRISDRMAKRVVDALELIKIEAKHGASAAARNLVQRLLQACFAFARSENTSLIQ